MKNYKVTIFYENGKTVTDYRKGKARFANELFKKLINKDYIKNVEIECIDDD